MLAAPFPGRGQNANLVIQPGTTVMLSGNDLVLYSTNLTCNGTFTAPMGVVWVSGNSSSSAGGTGTINMQVLKLNTGPSDTLWLNNTVQVLDSLDFLAGLIDLNGQQVQLSNTGALYNESETSRITGISGGEVVSSRPDAKDPNHLNIGNLGAQLISTADLGMLTISRSHKPAVDPHNSSFDGVQRTFLIQPMHDTHLKATLRFYYFNAELNGNDSSNLSLWKSLDGITWHHLGGDIRNPAGKFVQKNDIAELSYWTLADHNHRLSAAFILFQAICNLGRANLSWQTDPGLEADHFEVQKTTDGESWVKIGEVPGLPVTEPQANVPAANAPDNPMGSSYSFADLHPQDGASYRVIVTDINGETGFSPIFQGGCLDVTLPFIIFPNPSREMAIAQLSVREGSTATIEVYSVSGQLQYSASWGVVPGINQFKLPVSRLASGMYIVRVLVNGRVIETKLNKQ